MTADLHGPEGRSTGMRGRAVPTPPARHFRWFLTGYTTSLLGSSMAGVAVDFAVLATGRGGSAIGAVMTARILPLVLLLLLGGASADRFGSRVVMLTADTMRCTTQAAFAVLLLTGRPSLGAMLALSALAGVGEGLFSPALSALIPRLTPEEGLTRANSLLQIARSGTTVAGPALAGLLTALAGPAAVLALDAASYAVSVLVVFRLPSVRSAEAPRQSLVADLRAGWSLFHSRSWLWITTLHICLFNLLVWGPFLVLGPVAAQHQLGGARAWGAIMAGYGIGAVGGGLLMLRLRPPRPLLVAVLASLGWAFAPAALAAGLPLAWACLGSVAAGVGGSVYGTLSSTVIQRAIPLEFQGRVGAWTSLGAFVLGPVGLAGAGPLAQVLGLTTVLALGPLWLLVAVAAMTAVPSVRLRDP